MTDQSNDPFDRTFPIDTTNTTQRLHMPDSDAGEEPRPERDQATPPAATKTRNRTLFSDLRTGPPQRAALVVLVGIAVLTIAFIIMIFVNVSTESIIALAVIATPIASMVAAYYAVTLSIQQVKTERADKEKALVKLEAAVAGARETEVWASQMESGLRVAVARLDSAGISTVAVTRAAGTPEDFF
jgi:hypothetical protein